MSKHNDDYWDWYDNGPGSESFKRKIRENDKLLLDNSDFIRDLIFGRKKREKKREKVIDLPEELFEI
jgi:hypothetical protein